MTFLGRRWGAWHRLIASAAMLIAATLTALLAVTVVETIKSKDDALNRLRDTAPQVQLLTRRVVALTAELAATSRQSARQRSRLRTEIRILVRQIRQLGGEPVVDVTVRRSSSSSSGGSSPSPSSSPSPRPSRSPSPSPTPHPSRSPRPSPTPTCPLPPVTRTCIAENAQPI